MYIVLMIHERETGNVSHDNSKQSRARCSLCANKEPVTLITIDNGIVKTQFGYPTENKEQD